MELTLLAALPAALIASNLASIALAASRLRRRKPIAPPDGEAAAVSIVVPARGIEPFTAETLERAFSLDWPCYELVFCVAQPDDPVALMITDAMARFPAVPARLLIGDDRFSANPKLNNCIKGWEAARHDWVILADSNVLMPTDYIQHLMAAWREGTGLVCSTPIGSRPAGFWAEVECAFLNTLQARWQYAGEALGLGFAQGKSMLWNKPMLDANGGIRALAAEIAEDAAATKLVNGIGLRVNLVAAPFEQPLGRRSLGDIWSRQARWARLRRVTFPLFFLPEILTGVAVPLALALVAADATRLMPSRKRVRKSAVMSFTPGRRSVPVPRRAPCGGIRCAGSRASSRRPRRSARRARHRSGHASPVGRARGYGRSAGRHRQGTEGGPLTPAFAMERGRAPPHRFD